MTHCCSLLILLLLLNGCILQASAAFRPTRKWGSTHSQSCTFSSSNHNHRCNIDGKSVDFGIDQNLNGILQSLRAGATVEEVEEDDEVEEEEDQEEESKVVEESDDEDEESDEEETSEVQSADNTALSNYDEMLIPSPAMQMYSVIGVMLLSRKLDMFNPTVVRAGRFLYIAYVVLLQVFLLYVRIQAKSLNNRTPIQMTSPFSMLLESTQNAQVKNLASSLLSSQSTVLEYDLAQIKSMNGGLLMNMAFLWFLHYKMGQTQPLYLQTVQGLMNLYYSPLFQVYILGRNLERPFKNPTMSNKLLTEDKAAAAAAAATSNDGDDDAAADASGVTDDDDDDDDEDEGNDEDEEDEADVDEEDDDGETSSSSVREDDDADEEQEEVLVSEENVEDADDA